LERYTFSILNLVLSRSWEHLLVRKFLFTLTVINIANKKAIIDYIKAVPEIQFTNQFQIVEGSSETMRFTVILAKTFVAIVVAIPYLNKDLKERAAVSCRTY
jgi:hypothetical protein